MHELYRRALLWEPVERLPLIMAYPVPEDAPFKPYAHREVFDDPGKMLYNELVHAFGSSIAYRAQVGDDLPFTVRANFGTVIIASMFGAKIEQVDDNPPWVRHYESLDDFRRVFDVDPLDFTQGWCPRVIERHEFYRDELKSYPTLCKTLRLVLPDLQGPLDNADLLRGSEIYADLYLRPELIHDVQAILAKAQVGFARHLQPLITDGPAGFSHQHATTFVGKILIRDDSSIMVSPEMYREHVAPHDEFVLREMGGGGVHVCGNADHLAAEYVRLPSVRGIDLGQPEMNDLDSLYAHARERRIPLIRMSVPEDELVSGRVLARFPTGVTLRHEAASLQDAARIMSAYKRKAAERTEIRS